jgi:hypothetical protein
VVRKTLGILLVACLTIGSAVPKPLTPKHVTVQELLENPAAYEGAEVRLAGSLAIGFEMQNVYASRSDYDKESVGRCLALAMTNKQHRDVLHWNGRPVAISGIFRRRICPENFVCLGLCRNEGVDVQSMVLASP